MQLQQLASSPLDSQTLNSQTLDSHVPYSIGHAEYLSVLRAHTSYSQFCKSFLDNG